jgi:tetratricopeptide (TPR) repeat protein
LCGEALGTVDSSETILASARDCFERGDAFGAREILERGMAEAHADFRLQLAYAAVLLQDGEIEAGYEQLNQLQATYPWSPVVQAYAGGALLALGRVSESKDVLDEANARAPANFYVLLKRAELYCRIGVYATAIDALEQALRLPQDDRPGREAARRLLRFARDKSRRGFVRRLNGGLRLPLTCRWLRRWRVQAPRAASTSGQAWGV